MVSENPIELICCVCNKKVVSSNIFEAGWSLHENNGKRFDLCNRCHKIQEARDEQESQIRGNAPKPLSFDKQETSSLPLPSAVAGVVVRARFRLESIDVKVGDTLIAGDLTEAKEIRLPMSGDQLKIGEHYFVNLK